MMDKCSACGKDWPADDMLVGELGDYCSSYCKKLKVYTYSNRRSIATKIFDFIVGLPLLNWILVPLICAIALPWIIFDPTPTNGTSGRSGAAMLGCFGWIAISIISLISYLIYIWG